MSPVPPSSGRDEAHDAERALEQTRFELQELRRRARELESETSILRTGMVSLKADLDRIGNSRAWRWGHRISTLGARLARRRTRTRGAVAAALERIDWLEKNLSAPLADPQRAAVVSRTETAPSSRVAQRAHPGELGRRVRERLGPPPHLKEAPFVSIVVATRNGLELLKGLTDGLVLSTDYPKFELIVADNGSGDGTAEWVQSADLPFDVTLDRSEHNRSFAQANNEAARLARGDLLLFLNNDVEPVEDGWLTELVGAMRSGVAAVGATLVHGTETDPNAASGWIVQHRGIGFRPDRGAPRAFNLDDGQDVFSGAFGTDRSCPAVTAACLLVRRELFESVMGFPVGYHYGTEDVELGLLLTRRGHGIRCSGRAVLLHRESSTQRGEGREFLRLNRAENRKVLLQRWAPQIRREHRLDRLRGGGQWSDTAPHIALTVTSADAAAGWGDWYTAHEMGDALLDLGWRVTYAERSGDRWYDLPHHLDYALVLMDTFDARRLSPDVIAVAWIRNWTQRWLERPWFDRFDLLLASSASSARLIREATGREAKVFPLATNPERFTPAAADDGEAHDYVFTGNRWGEDRAIQPALPPPPGQRMAIYGLGWEKLPPFRPYARGHASYDELPAIYASAKVVLDDTASPTLPYGAVNARVFDALACGTPVLTNCVTGVRELFDEEFPVWNSPEELRAELDRLLSDPERRKELATRYRSEVLLRHTYRHRARELRETLDRLERQLSFCIKIGAPNWDAATRWGDLYFASGVARELRRRGHRCLIQVLEEWADPEGLACDVAIVLRGLSRHTPWPAQLNVLWVISHPADVDASEYDGYDLIGVASERHLQRVRSCTRTPALLLEQATDPRVFYPDADLEHEHELAFVGNSRNVRRRMIEDVLPTSRELAVYGANWAGLIEERLVIAEHFPNHELRKVYSSAGIVLSDHWEDMRANGFISNRVYDAVACGALVISDRVDDIEDRFAGAVVTYETPDQLHALIERFLDDPEERAARGAAGRARVLSEHTFANRVESLLEAVSERIELAHHPLRIGV